MAKFNKTFVSNFFSSTMGDKEWTVISFSKETGRRDMAYLAYDFFSAFAVMTEQLAKGKFDVIITNKKGVDEMNKLEAGFKRCQYKDMLPHAIKVSSFSGEINGKI